MEEPTIIYWIACQVVGTAVGFCSAVFDKLRGSTLYLFSVAFLCGVLCTFICGFLRWYFGTDGLDGMFYLVCGALGGGVCGKGGIEVARVAVRSVVKRFGGKIEESIDE